MSNANAREDHKARPAPAPDNVPETPEGRSELVGTTSAAATPVSPGERSTRSGTRSGTTPISGTAPSAPAVPGNTPTDCAPDYGSGRAHTGGQAEARKDER